MMPKVECLKKELIMSVMKEQYQSISPGKLAREVPFPNGFELAFYTVRSLHDGQLLSFQLPVNSNDDYVQAVPIASELLGIELLQKPQEDQRSLDTVADSQTLSLHLSTNNSLYQDQTSTQQQTYSIAIRGGLKDIRQSDTRYREPSMATLRRRAHARNDGYTTVCGVFSPETSKPPPVKKFNPGQGDYCCPRCGSNYTRPKTVKDHFFGCVTKHGNPNKLRFTDHTSMAYTEACIQWRNRASQETSYGSVEETDAEMGGRHHESRIEAMSEALFVDSTHKERNSGH